MDTKFPPIEDIRSALDRLRKDPKTQRKFPPELWTSIIQHTKIHPIEEVCRHLQINSIYLKRKIREFKGPGNEPAFEFQEVVMPVAQPAADTVTIELQSVDGLQAKIHGPLSCLNYLNQLFRR
jgi:hypothetical protein